MTKERYHQLQWGDPSSELTTQEWEEGWRFCYEFDGLLLNINEDDNECTNIGCTACKQNLLEIAKKLR
jgi:hypothetical protein